MKKTIIAFITSVFVLSMAIITPLNALEGTIAFTSQDDQIAVTLNVSDTSVEALTMKASFEIKAENKEIEKNDIQFNFDESIQSSIKEYRYDNNILTIYISGNDNLFANEQIKLGTIDFNVSKETKITVSLVTDSLEYVLPTYSKDVLEAQDTSIVWGGISTPTTPEDQEDSQDQQKPSEDVGGNGNENTTQDSNVNPSSQVKTGDNQNAFIYAGILVISILVILFTTKRVINNKHH